MSGGSRHDGSEPHSRTRFGFGNRQSGDCACEMCVRRDITLGFMASGN